MKAVEKLIDKIELKAKSIPTNTQLNRSVKGAYVDCLIMLKKAKEMEKYDIKDNKIMLLQEDLECVNMYLDDLKLPRTDDKGNKYSIVGRIKRLEERMYSEEWWSDLSDKFYESNLVQDYKDGKIDFRFIRNWFIEQSKNK